MPVKIRYKIKGNKHIMMMSGQVKMVKMVNSDVFDFQSILKPYSEYCNSPH